MLQKQFNVLQEQFTAITVYCTITCKFLCTELQKQFTVLYKLFTKLQGIISNKAKLFTVLQGIVNCTARYCLLYCKVFFTVLQGIVYCTVRYYLPMSISSESPRTITVGGRVVFSTFFNVVVSVTVVLLELKYGNFFNLQQKYD